MRCIKRIEMDDNHIVSVYTDHPGHYEFRVGGFIIGNARKRNTWIISISEKPVYYRTLDDCAKSYYTYYLQEQKA